MCSCKNISTSLSYISRRLNSHLTDIKQYRTHVNIPVMVLFKAVSLFLSFNFRWNLVPADGKLLKVDHDTWQATHNMMASFCRLLAFCAGNSPTTGELPEQRPVTRSVDVCFDLHPNQQLSKQWRRRWFETPSRSLWRHCNKNEQTYLWKSAYETFVSHFQWFLNTRNFI